MAQELVVRLWCDHCLRTSGDKVEGETVGPITINGKPLVAEACEHTRTTVVDPFLTFMREYGRVEGKPVPRVSRGFTPDPVQPRNHGVQRVEGKRPCLLCDEVLNTRQTLDNHYVTVHGVKVAQVFGNRCPACNLKTKSLVGLAQHAARTHRDGTFGDWDDLSQLFDMLRSEDPHGVVAERLAEVQRLAA